MADLQYLIDREREEELRTCTRTLIFPDGTSHRIEVYRLVWQWYDRLLKCEFTFEEDEILAMVPRCADHEGIEYTEALTSVVAVLVGRLDRIGIDVIDDMLPLQIARQGMENWTARKSGRDKY